MLEKWEEEEFSFILSPIVLTRMTDKRREREGRSLPSSPSPPKKLLASSHPTKFPLFFFFSLEQDMGEKRGVWRGGERGDFAVNYTLGGRKKGWVGMRGCGKSSHFCDGLYLHTP